jgi:hypothetical protein
MKRAKFKKGDRVVHRDGKPGVTFEVLRCRGLPHPIFKGVRTTLFSYTIVGPSGEPFKADEADLSPIPQNA